MTLPTLNPGLVWLLRRSPQLLWRSSRKRLKGPKGILLALVVVGFLLVVLAPAAIQSMIEASDPVEMAARARMFAPLAMLAMAVLSMLTPAQRRGGLYFRPAEVGMLFPAPLSRRELLAYHVISRAQVQVLSGLWISVFLMRYAPTWYGCIVGATLTLLLVQLVAETLALATAAAGKRVARPLRWGLLLSVFVALLAGAATAVTEIRLDGGPLAAAYAFAAHPLVQLATLPFVPFANTFAATTFVELLVWGSASAVLLGGLVGVIARLDVAYEEAALDVSREVQRKLVRIRSGGGALAAMGPSQAKFSVPRLPAFGGAGPVAWRQCVEIVRNLRAVAMSLLLLLIWPAIAGGAVLLAETDGGKEVQKLGAAAIPVVWMFSVVWMQNLSFDFRRDLDRIAHLRSLPLSSIAVATGQVAPSAFLLAAMQFVVIALIVVTTGLLPLVLVPTLFPLLLLLAWTVVALDNMLFLFFPHRIDPDDPANVGFMGKLMLVMSLKFAGLFAIAAMAGVVGAGLIWGVGLSPVVGGLAAIVILVSANVVLTLLVALSYDAFDPSRDVPA